MKLSDDDFDGLKRWRISAPKGRMIYDQDEEAEAFYRVESGCVRLQVNREDGGRQILAFHLPGDIFGLDCDGRRHAAAEAAIRSELTRFQAPPPLGMSANPGAAAAVACAACEMVNALAGHLMGLGHANAEDRVRWFLGWLAERQGIDACNARLHLPMSRRDIADFLDLAPETLSRTMRRLESLREIEVMGTRRIVLRKNTRRPSDRGGPVMLVA